MNKQKTTVKKILLWIGAILLSWFILTILYNTFKYIVHRPETWETITSIIPENETEEINEGIAEEHKQITKDDATQILFDYLKKSATEGQTFSIVSYSDETKLIDGKECWEFSVGDMTPEKFTAHDHYAVSETGAIYHNDIFQGEYREITSSD